MGLLPRWRPQLRSSLDCEYVCLSEAVLVGGLFHLYCVLVAMPVLMMARPAPNCCVTLRAPTLVTQKLKIKIQRSVFSVRYCMRHNCAEQERRQRNGG